MIELFFEKLSERFRSENDLSDITWSVCQASETFKLAFLNFFFPNIDFSKTGKFEREKSQGDSRPDFFIENNDLTYLIESKIYDGNHHFTQYTETFKIPPERLGYITNYKMSQSGFIIKTWEELYNYLLLNEPNDNIEKAVWQGYLKYLKEVCNIITITKKMELRGLHSLYSFIEILKKLVNRSEYNIDLRFYSLKNIHGGNGSSGCYFEISYPENIICKTWAWVGIYYNHVKPVICIGFERTPGWGKPVYDIINSNYNIIFENEFSEKPYEEDNVFWFNLREEKMDMFETLDLENQIKMLKEFIDLVIRVPYDLVKNGAVKE